MINKCKICGNEFYAKPWHIKMGWGLFCSSNCHHISMRIGKIVYCDQCKVELYRNNTQIKNSKSGKFFCSKSCQTKWRNKFFSGDKHKGWIFGETTYRKVMINSGQNKICGRCFKKDERILVVHHLDHNRKNYDIKNLIWLCRNCHFLIHYDKLEEVKLLEKVKKI